MRFGTDGVRGRAGETVTATGAMALGAAVVEALGPRVAVAGDPRPSSPMLVAAVAAGVAAAGGEAVDLGTLPSPALSWHVARFGFDAGVMVTASHNPAADNGLKVFGADGSKPDAATRAALEARLAAPRLSGPPGRVRRDADAGAAYVEALLAAVGGGRWLKAHTIVLDTANGASTGLAARVLGALGARVWAMGDGPGDRINDGVGALHPEALAARVVEVGADAGIALDGDGDRGALVDAHGRVLDGDALLWLAAGGAVEPPAVVGTVMTNLGLEHALGGLGVRLLRTAVGDAEVAEGMRRIGARLGGEPSGHLLFADGPPTADGLYACLRALRPGVRTLADRLSGYVPATQAHGTVPGGALPPGRIDAAVAGLERAGARVVVRPSGTEPVVRVMVEHVDPAVARAGLDSLLSLLTGASS